MKPRKVFIDQDISCCGFADVAGYDVSFSAERLSFDGEPESWRVRATCQRDPSRPRQFSVEIKHVPTRARAVACVDAAAAAVVALANGVGDT
jgi:hypothetical protein